MPRRHKAHERQIARERIGTLSDLAATMALAGDLEHADRYVQLARRLGMRYNVRLPRDLRARICRECLRYLLPGVTCSVRVHRGRIRTTCRYCGTVYRHPYMREQKALRKRRASAG